jgi:hypothetical protein
LTPDTEEPIDVYPVLTIWVRLLLVVIAVGLTVVFGIALWLDPYWRAGPADRPEFVASLMVAPEAGLSGLPWGAWCVSAQDDAPVVEPLRMETHRKLGLQPCTFKEITGLPCPSCGMTTSFAHLVRGDVWNSLRANAVGTVLASFCLLLIPWSAASVLKGRTLFVVSLDRAVMCVVITLMTLMLLRWGVVLGLTWSGYG